jgi:hypothetical protein
MHARAANGWGCSRQVQYSVPARVQYAKLYLELITPGTVKGAELLRIAAGESDASHCNV